jgi:hypothetical protein
VWKICIWINHKLKYQVKSRYNLKCCVRFLRSLVYTLPENIPVKNWNLVTLKNFTFPLSLIYPIIQTNLTTVTDSPVTKFHLHIIPLSQSNNSINVRTAKTFYKNSAKLFPTINRERKFWNVKCTLTLSHKHTKTLSK